ncbi:MAG: PAC2 family protein [Dehalococcoidia bacterium]|nr:PAC2 family protein [Dehalococcoidia bacterium]
MRREHPGRVHWNPGLDESSLVVGWSMDGGNLGRRTTDYLNRKLDGQEFAEIEPEFFFALGGVAVKDDLARFPESKFSACREHGLVVFRSDFPESEPYGFLNSVLDVAEQHCNTKELYVVGAMVGLGAHTTPRQLFAIASSEEMKEALNQYDLVDDLDYETPPGERPTPNSFLLWAAERRGIPGVSLWVPIPFYLAGMEDVQAQRKVLGFLDERLALKLDFGDLDQEIRAQNDQLARARSAFPQVDDYIGRLESNLRLSDEENGELVKRIESFLSQGG